MVGTPHRVKSFFRTHKIWQFVELSCNKKSIASVETNFFSFEISTKK